MNRRYFNKAMTAVLLLILFAALAPAQEEIRLLVRADDMGISYDVNLAIIRAHKKGIVTSASIMPPADYYEEAVALCKENPTLAVGIHLTLLATRQRPVLSPEEVPSIVTPQGFLYENREQLENAQPSLLELEKEIRAQIGKVRASGLQFCYLEEHRGNPPFVVDIIKKICREQQLIYGEGNEVHGYTRIKLQPAGVVQGHTLPDGHVVHYAAPSYTEKEEQYFFDMLNGLQPGRWWSKSHPGLAGTKADLTELLCDPRASEIIKKKNIRMVSFRDVWEEQYGRKSSPSIRLLVRADDMGVSHDKNLAIIKAYKEGIVTSAGIMPTSSYFEEAVRLCRENPGMAAGIHLTLLGTRERPVLSPAEVPTLVNNKGFFYETMEQLEKAGPEPAELEREIRAQVGKVRASGLDFVYMDMHRGVPLQAIEEIMLRICREERIIYAEHLSAEAYPNYERIDIVPESWPNKTLPGGRIVYYAAPAFSREDRQSFLDALDELEPGRWMTLVHPGLADPQRASVTELMCAPETLSIIRNKQIELVGYDDLQGEIYGKRQVAGRTSGKR